MKKCNDLALIAKQRGESPVAAVIVRNGDIIAEGIEGIKKHKDITFHAEIEAIRYANIALNRQDLSDCILYSTHEPCIMCSYVVRQAKIPMLVMGTTTGEIGGFSSQYPLLLDNSIKKWGNAPEIIMLK